MTRQTQVENPDSRLGDGVTRRDFLGATLLGTGAALLNTPCPAAAQGLGREWTGYGGVGDYRFSNGNAAAVGQSAHAIRDRWGCAFYSPPPGLFFGKDGQPSPLKVSSEPFGRVVPGAAP